MQLASEAAPDALRRPYSFLRPGVAFPDWSVVTSASASAALNAMLEAAWGRRAWQDYTPAEDAVRQTILELYRDLGRAPSPEEIARRADTGPDQVRLLLRRLAARDLIVLEDDEIIGASPLTDRRASIGWLSRIESSMPCAPSMRSVSAPCTGPTQRSIRAAAFATRRSTGDAGSYLATLSPAEAVVFTAVEYRSGCAATSLCTTIAFFCSEAHLSAWRSSQSFEGPTFRLSIGEALEVGRAIFGPVLKAPQDQPEVYR